MSERNIPFFQFSMEQSAAHKEHFIALPLQPDEAQRCQQEVAESLAAQQAIEEADELDFQSFLTQYLTIPAPSQSTEKTTARSQEIGA